MAVGLVALSAAFQTSTNMDSSLALNPSLRASVFYDLIGDQAEATTTYKGGGAAFDTSGADVEKFGGSIGVGLMATNDNVSLSANYDATIKHGFIAHAGELRLNIGF